MYFLSLTLHLDIRHLKHLDKNSHEGFLSTNFTTQRTNSKKLPSVSKTLMRYAEDLKETLEI